MGLPNPPIEWDWSVGLPNPILFLTNTANHDTQSMTLSVSVGLVHHVLRWATTLEPRVLNIFFVASLYYKAPQKKIASLLYYKAPQKKNGPKSIGPAVVGVRNALFTSIGPGFDSRRGKKWCEAGIEPSPH